MFLNDDNGPGKDRAREKAVKSGNLSVLFKKFRTRSLLSVEIQSRNFEGAKEFIIGPLSINFRKIAPWKFVMWQDKIRISSIFLPLFPFSYYFYHYSFSTERLSSARIYLTKVMTIPKLVAPQILSCVLHIYSRYGHCFYAHIFKILYKYEQKSRVCIRF